MANKLAYLWPLVVLTSMACGDEEGSQPVDDSGDAQTSDGGGDAPADADTGGGDAGDAAPDLAADGEDTTTDPAGEPDAVAEDLGPDGADAIGEDTADVVEDVAQDADAAGDAPQDTTDDTPADPPPDTADAADGADTGVSGEELAARPNNWGVNGQINDFLVYDGDLYIAGEFDYAGPPTGPLAAFHPNGSGEAVPTPGTPSIRGLYVEAMISDGAGGLFLGGSIESVDGVAVGDVVHIDASGELDPAFSVDITNPLVDVHALALGDDALYMGGLFTVINGATRPFLVAVNPDSGAVLAFGTGEALDGAVYGIAVAGGVVYVSGDFTEIGDASRPLGLAALDAETGAATSWNPTGGDVPTSLARVAVHGETVYTWGDGFGGEEIAAFDADGAAITDFAPNANGTVRDLIPTDDAIWVAGDFSQIGGESRQALAALVPATGETLPFDPDWTFEDGLEPLGVLSIALDGDTLYAYLGGRLVAFDVETGALTPFEVRTTGSFTFSEILIDGSDVLLASDFRSAGGVAQDCLAVFGMTTAFPIQPFAPTMDDGTGGCQVNAMANIGTELFIGGVFSEVMGEPRAFLALLDGEEVQAWDPGADDAVNALYATDDTLYVGGDFSTLGGDDRDHVGALDTDGVLTDWSPAADGPVHAIILDDDIVYIAGDFSEIGGEPRDNIAAIDADTGLATDWDPSADGEVNAILLHNGLIYIGGAFEEVGGVERLRLAAIEPDGDLDDWAPAAQGTVRSLAASDAGGAGGADSLYVGGAFDSIAGSPASTVVEVSGSSGLAVAWAPPSQLLENIGLVNALVVDASNLYAGGLFDWMGDERTLNLVVLDRD